MTKSSALDPQKLLRENRNLRDRITRLEAAETRHQETLNLLRKSMNELEGLKRALDESSIFNITNREGKIIYANQKFCQLSGYSREEIFGQTHRLINSGYHSQAFFSEMWHTISRGEIWHGEIRNKARDGAYFWVNTTIIPLLGDNDKPQFFLGVRNDVTQQKLIEAALNQQSDLAYRVMEISGNIVVGIDMHGNIVLMNHMASNILGCNTHHVIGNNWFETFVIPCERQAISERYQEFFRTGINQTNYLEYGVLTQSGDERIVAWQIVILHGPDNQPAGIVSAGIDITERRRMELLQNGRRQVLEELATGSPLHEVIPVLTQNFDIIGSDIICTVQLIDPDDCLLHLQPGSALPEDLAAAIATTPIDPNAITCGRAAYYKRLEISRDLSKEKTWRPMRKQIKKAGIKYCMSHPILSPHEDVFGTITTFHTQLKSPSHHENETIHTAAQLAAMALVRNKIVNELAESIERLRAIVDTTIDGIITINDKGLIETFNHASEIMFGYQAHEVIGKNISMLMPAPIARHHDSYLTNYLNTGVKKIIGIGREVEGKKKDGTLFPLFLGVSESFLFGRRRLFTGILRDLTQQKEADQTLLKTREELMFQSMKTQRLASLATMAGGIAHELNQPLSGIRVYAETVKSLVESTDSIDIKSMRTTLVKIINQVDRASKIIDHIRQFASDKTDHHWEIHNFRKIVASALELVGARLANHGITIINEVSAQVKIRADKMRIEQVLINLITNAMDSIESKSSDRSLRREIKITSQIQKDSIYINVIDTGSGVPESIRESLFDPFVSTKGPDRGMGLGLSICHGILKDHHATISLTHTSPDGSVFSLNFPKISKNKFF